MNFSPPTARYSADVLFSPDMGQVSLIWNSVTGRRRSVEGWMKHHTLACRQFNTPSCPKVAVADKTRCFCAFAQVMQCVWPLFVSPLEQRMQRHRFGYSILCLHSFSVRQSSLLMRNNQFFASPIQSLLASFSVLAATWTRLNFLCFCCGCRFFRWPWRGPLSLSAR